MSVLRGVRVAILLAVLVAVVVSGWQMRARTTAWDEPLWVAIYPVLGDDTGSTREYVRQLHNDDYADIGEFLQREARRYGLILDAPLHVQVRPIQSMPPLPPARGVLQTMWWSLRLRYRASRVRANDDSGPPPHIQLFVIFHDPALRERVPHSLGLQKGLVGIVHAFASAAQASENRVVIAHELLHTLGATDKYALDTGQPIYPQGYAEPQREPLFPQRLAEIMGGRVPLHRARSRMPRSLQEVTVGELTAREINWLR